MTSTATRPFLSLTVSDLMSDNVLMLPAEMSLQGAARLLSRANVSGAPVVDADGRCIGVLSALDFLHVAEKGEMVHAHHGHDMCRPWEIVDAETFADDCIRSHMTADPVFVSPAMRIGELAQRMLDAHIHRAIVVDRNQKPVGIVSTTDILAAVARAEKVR
jgi:CBS domain-containing protein